MSQEKKPYPVLERLYDANPVLTKLVNEDAVALDYLESRGVVMFDRSALTPAEVLALADELKAFVAAQTQTTAMAELPSGDPT